MGKTSPKLQKFPNPKNFWPGL